MTPTPTVNVRGRVVNGVTGQPVVDTLVSIPPLRGVRTGALGVFDIPGVPSGSAAFEEQGKTVRIGEGGRQTLDLQVIH
jgi:hypothetical protein